jgi:hypothetical protein
MIKEPSEDDFDLQVYSFADGHDPSELYVVDGMDDPAAETDLMILYSHKKLPPKSFPKPAKSERIPFQSTEIGLIAYHGVEAESIYLDYPYTKDADLETALDKLVPDRLTLVKGITGVRNDPHLLYHRCSSAAGSSGGALINNSGELVGMILLNVILMAGIHVEGEYNEDGVVDWSCENIGVALDSPALQDFIRDVVVPIVLPESRDAWIGLLKA